MNFMDEKDDPKESGVPFKAKKYREKNFHISFSLPTRKGKKRRPTTCWGVGGCLDGKKTGLNRFQLSLAFIIQVMANQFKTYGVFQSKKGINEIN